MMDAQIYISVKVITIFIYLAFVETESYFATWASLNVEIFPSLSPGAGLMCIFTPGSAMFKSVYFDMEIKQLHLQGLVNPN